MEHLPRGWIDRGYHVCGDLRSKTFGQPPGLIGQELVELLFGLVHFLLVFLPRLDFRFGNERALLVGRTCEHTGQRVVILRSEGIVLVIVTTGASHRNAEHTAGHHVHTVMPLVGPGLRRLRDAVIPRTQSEKAGGRQ